MAVVGAAVGVLAEQPLELGAPEEAAVGAAEQQVLGRAARSSLAEPAVERDAEARLRRAPAISGGRSAANACLSASLPAASSGGSARPSSTTRWSRNGERSSSETAIEAMSAFGSRSPGRYDSMSTSRRSGSSGSIVARGVRARLVRPERAAQLEREHLDEAGVALGRRAARRRRGSAGRGRGVERGSRRAAGTAPSAGAAERGGEPRHAPRERVRPVALVAAEGLVAAVADERDRDVAARRLADEQRRQRRLVAERLVEGLGDALEQLRPRVDLELLVPRRRTARRRRGRTRRSS